MLLNKITKKIVAFLLLITTVIGTVGFLFCQRNLSIFAETLNPKEWYDKYGIQIRFDKDRQALKFVSRAKAAPDNSYIRFRTIGWQVRFEPTDGSEKFLTRVSLSQGKTQVVDGYHYSEFLIPISPSSNQPFKPSILEALVRDFGSQGYDMDYFTTKFSKGVNIYFDSINSICEQNTNEPNAIMDANGNVVANPKAPKGNRGEHYFTKDGKTLATTHKIKPGWAKVSSYDTSKGGIKGARWWSNPNTMFEDYFNRTTYYKKEEVILQKTVKYSHWTVDGKCLDANGELLLAGKHDIKKGQTISVDVTSKNFTGYTLKYSAISHHKKPFEGDYSARYGSAAKTRTINVTTDKEEHIVYFYYESDNAEASTNPNGLIRFNPKQSSDISGNRSGWVKNNIAVQVSVDTKYKEVTRYAWENRTYTGGTIQWAYQQTWYPSQLKVWGEGKTVDGDKVNIDTVIIKDGGTITIQKELKDIRLYAEVDTWLSKSDKKYVAGNPPSGSWTKHTPSGSTSAPHAVFPSISGLYYLDKTKPVINNLSLENSDWTNQDIKVEINVSDNLSGLYQYGSYVRARDTSYYGHSKGYEYFTNKALSDKKTITLNEDGVFELDIRLEDTAKNVQSETFGVYKIDKTKPYEPEFTRDRRNYIDEDLTVTVYIADNLSGIEKTYCLASNSPNYPDDLQSMELMEATTPENKKDETSFDVHITEPGSWWIHVCLIDRAGNITYSTSREYKIIRLGLPDNTSGGTFTGVEDGFYIAPLQMNHRVPKGVRFDTILEVLGLSQDDIQHTDVQMIVPRWVDDEVDYKVNGNYSYTSGKTNRYRMVYNSGQSKNIDGTASPDTIACFWQAFMAPYGVPASRDKNGVKQRESYKIQVRLLVSNYQPHETHVSVLEFDVVPDTKIKTEIIENEY